MSEYANPNDVHEYNGQGLSFPRARVIGAHGMYVFVPTCESCGSYVPEDTHDLHVRWHVER